MTLEEELIRLIDECPIGHDGRGNLVRTRAATDAGVVAWVDRLHAVKARLRDPARASASAVLYGSAGETAGGRTGTATAGGRTGREAPLEPGERNRRKW